MIIDNACDQSILHSDVCVVLSKSNVFYYVDGAMPDMHSSEPLQVVNAVTLVSDPYSGNKWLCVVNQCLLLHDNSHREALLQPNQARDFGTIVDDCARIHMGPNGRPGGQFIQVPGTTIPLLHDGWKAYLSVSKPSDKDLKSMPQLELTSPLPYEPSIRVCTRRVSKLCEEEVKFWTARLGYPPEQVVRHTLGMTSQLVKTVEAESRMLMRDHKVTRLYPLRPHRINDVCFSDTFFASVSSIRGYSMFQLFCLRDAKTDFAFLMRKKSQAPSKFADFVRDIGAPNYMINDNAQELSGEEWTKVARHAMVSTYFSEAEHQNQNLAERRGGAIKDALQILYLNTPHAPLSYW